MISSILDLARGSVSGKTVTLVLIALLVLLIVARVFIVLRSDSENRGLTPAARRRDRARDAWAEAERLAAAGEHTAAAHALFEALVASCAARGEVRLHPSKTAGDYARELAVRSSPAAAPFRLFRVRYDAVIYGEGNVDEVTFTDLLARARPVLDRASAS